MRCKVSNAPHIWMWIMGKIGITGLTIGAGIYGGIAGFCFNTWQSPASRAAYTAVWQDAFSLTFVEAEFIVLFFYAPTLLLLFYLYQKLISSHTQLEYWLFFPLTLALLTFTDRVDPAGHALTGWPRFLLNNLIAGVVSLSLLVYIKHLRNCLHTLKVKPDEEQTR